MSEQVEETTPEPEARQRPMPWNQEAEESLVGSMLLTGDARRRGLRGCAAEDLWSPELRAIYRAIESLHDEGRAVDPVTVHDRLRESGVQNISRARIVEVQSAAPISASVGAYAEIVVRFARLREGMRLGEDLVAAGQQRDFDTFDALVAEAEGRLRSRALAVDTYDLLDLWDLAEQERDDPTKPYVIPGCLRSHELIAYTGSEGLGKSTYLRQIGTCVAAGIHPFTGLTLGMQRQRVLAVDLQEDELDLADELAKLRRGLADHYERGWYRTVSMPEGIDLLAPRGQRVMEGLLDEHRPALVMMGPVNSMFRAQAGQSRYGEDTIEELRAVMVDLMKRYDFALVLEGHAGNDRSHDEDWRIRGSSVWRSWPAFSHGLKEIAKDPREVDVIRARRDRYDGRVWPTRLFQRPAWRFPWSVSENDYSAILRHMGLHHLLGEGDQQTLTGEETF